MKILLAKPMGFCAGVKRAIEIVELSLKKYGAPIYVKHEIVHNKYVVDDLRKKGVIFVEDVSEIPVGANTVFSAHGVSDQVEKDSETRELNTVDATCPLVKKVHRGVVKYETEGYKVILIGHHGHPEMEGTSGRIKNCIGIVETVEDVQNLKLDKNDKIAYSTQTTLSLDDTKTIISALKTRFPHIIGPDTDDICYATQNRQDAVKKLVHLSDAMIVIGSQTSSNSRRLFDIARDSLGIDKSIMIDAAEEIKKDWLNGINSLGITAGASAPDELVESVIDHIITILAPTKIEVEIMADGIEEDVIFHVPKKLRDEDYMNKKKEEIFGN